MVNAEPAPLGRHLYRSAMPRRDHPDDRQAQAEAGDLLGAGGIGPAEGLKDMGRGVHRPICVDGLRIRQGQEAIRHLCLRDGSFPHP